jgi:serine/threonine protein kinase
LSDDDPNRTVATGSDVPVSSTNDRPSIPDVILDAEIGRGGMGVVYRGRQTYLDRRVAIKLLLVDKTSADDEYVKRFQREAKILAGLAHPHIVSCYSAGLTEARQPYLIMEFIDGPNLKDWVAKHGTLPEKHAVRIIRDLAFALNHAHEHKIIHRDVKPENVLLAKNSEAVNDPSFPFQAKLVDLGLARPSTTNSDLNLTVSGRVMGTPTTMAPEQFDNPDGVDFRADMYGLGCILFYSLTGKSAFSGQTISQLLAEKMNDIPPDPRAINSQVSTSVCELVAALLAKDRTHRPVNYQDLIAKCEQVLVGDAPKRSPALMLMGIAVGLVALVIVIFMSTSKTTATVAPQTTEPVNIPLVAAQVAPTAPTKDSSAHLPLGEPQSLWPHDVSTRLQSWTVASGAQWANSEAFDNGLAGFSGIIKRPLAGDRWEISTTFTLANVKEADTKRLRVGVMFKDQSQIFVNFVNLTSILALTIERTFADSKTPSELIASSQAPVTETTLGIAFEGEFLRLRINGIPVEKGIGLPGAPTHLFFEVEGLAPVEVSTCSIRLPGKEVLK